MSQIAEAMEEEPRKCDECGSKEQPVFLFQDKVNRCLSCATKYLPENKEPKH